MIAGTRAKITDFGMSKLATVNPRMTALTMCPGNVLYMSPEALDEAKTYTAKLDIFSFGVIVIQILTRQFPNPTDRFRTIPVITEEDEEENDESDDEDEEVRRVVPETKRREAHLKLIPDTHPLKSLILRCLKKKEGRRPSALQLSERISELKQSSQYTESSMHQTQSDTDIQQLQQQLRGQRILTEAKTREVQEHQTRNTELQNIVEDKNRQLQDNQAMIQAKDRQLQENQAVIQAKDRQLQVNATQLQAKNSQLQAKDRQLQANNRQLQAKNGQLQKNRTVIQAKDRQLQVNATQLQAKDRQLQECQHTIASRDHAVETKGRELQQTQGQLRASEQLVSEFQQSLQQKDKTITDLQQTISAHERKIQQLEQQDTASRDLPQQKSVTTSQKMMAAVQKDISKMKWREGKNAPEKMIRGAAVVHNIMRTQHTSHHVEFK